MKSKVWKIVLSVVIAFGLWLYVVTVVSPGSEKTYYDIPVILQNEAILQREGLMITAIEDDSVTLQLQGNRTDLNQLNESNINIFANLASVVSPGTHRVKYEINYPGNIASDAVTTQSKQPDMLTIKVENRVTRQLPVEIVYVGAVSSEYIADKEKAELDYPTIEVKGAESQVTKIASCRIQVDLQNKTASFSEEFEYAFYDVDGNLLQLDDNLVTTNVREAKGEKTINLYLNIQRYKESKLKLTVVPGGGATEATCQIQIKPETIGISGSEAMLSDLDELNIGTLQLGEIPENTNLTFPIVLPEGVTNVTGISEVSVEVQFPDLMTKAVRVTDIDVINLPEGLQAEILTKEIEVTIRGPIKLMRNLKASDVSLTVDLTDAKAGTETVTATVVLGGDYGDAGALGTYNIAVAINAAENAEKEQS